MSPKDLDRFKYDWYVLARESQLPPAGDWTVWSLCSGRGSGKTWTGANWVKERIESGVSRRMALIARTPADVRDTMVQGESGILAISRPDFMPEYQPGSRRVSWPNGAFALCFSSFQPELLRGPQFDSAWCDEVSAWEYALETWDNLMLALRLGDDPRCVATFTPKPTAIVRRLLSDSNVAVTRGTTFDNRANLAPEFFDRIVAMYEGTTRGRQEIYGELLEEAEGALWQRNWIEDHRVGKDTIPDLVRTVVAIDPAVTSDAGSDETGIVVVGMGFPEGQGKSRPHYYVLADLSGRYTPERWAHVAAGAFEEHKGDRIIGEANNGGDMIEATLRAVNIQLPYKKVWASKGKAARAEPVAALYQQGQVHHVGVYPALEDQMVTWEPLSGTRSPDRIDALVWAISEMMARGSGLPLHT
jgi:phage terminase large subunit-like protein